MKDSSGREPKPASISFLIRLLPALPIVLAAALLAPRALALPYVVFRPSPLNCYQLYYAGSGGRIPLLGTEKMASVVVGDVDGNGLADELVYADTRSGGLGYYRIPSDARWHPENDRVIPGVAADAVPLAVVRTSATGSPGLIVCHSAAAGYTSAVMPDGKGVRRGRQAQRLQGRPCVVDQWCRDVVERRRHGAGSRRALG